MDDKRLIGKLIAANLRDEFLNAFEIAVSPRRPVAQQSIPCRRYAQANSGKEIRRACCLVTIPRLSSLVPPLSGLRLSTCKTMGWDTLLDQLEVMDGAGATRLLGCRDG